MVDLSTADPLVGQVLDGRYRVSAKAARGGMATVYLAVDTRLDRPVAVKVMHPSLAEDERFVERFRREARAAARLSHPNVVAVHDQGEDAGRVYLVMEQVSGTTLRGLLRRDGRLDPDRALGIVEGVLAALAAAHDAGIVHRDVKPENVLVAADGTVKVADFGLARAVEATHHTLADGALIGTVAYLAPEQVATGAADPRTDLYATGVVLFELLTGAPPYAGDTPLAVAYRHVNEDVPPPSSHRPGLSPRLDELVVAATRRDPDARFQDARSMLSAVRRARAALATGNETVVLPLADAETIVTPLPVPASVPVGRTEPAAAAPPTGKPPDRPPAARRRRRRAVVASIVVLVLALAAGAGWYLGSARWVDAPQLVGLSVAEARARAAAGDVALHLGDPVFSDTVPEGRIAEQDPAPGDRIRRGARLTVHPSRGVETVVVPDVVGMTEAAARTELVEARLRVGRRTREYHDTVPEGRVIRTGAEPGSRKRHDSPVDLVVSRGRQPVPVPDVVGDPAGAAERELKAAGLQVQQRLEFHDSVPRGRVIRQTPAAGATAFRNDPVTLVVSNGPPVVTVPDVIGRSRAVARELLERAGLRVREVEFPGRRGGRVYDQSPAGGTEVRRGTTVTVYLV